MPRAPLKPCGHPGCGVLVSAGLCDKHRKDQVRQYESTPERKAAKSLYATKRWQDLRVMTLRANPLCVECRKVNRLTAAEHVDHIVAHGDLLRKTWSTRHQGSARAHLPAVLTGGLKVEPITLNAADAQLLETRRFNVEEIARIFGVPPHLIGHTDKTTSWGSGIESMMIGFIQFTLSRHLNAIEQELNRKLFSTAAQFLEFSVEGLLRGDTKSRAEFYKSALGGSSGPAWMTVNEVRALENRPPIEGGDQLTQWERNNVQVPAGSTGG